MIEKWRGIATNPTPRHELVAKTIVNRLGQKSMGLPRIDDKKRFAGFPGNTGVAKKIAEKIPNCFYYIEPFAGSAKVYQELKKNQYAYAVLNDKSKFVYDWLCMEFSSVITNMDFVECMLKYDSEQSFFLIDHPWFKSFYDQSFSCFDREKVTDYDEQVLDICKKLKGNFMITTRKENNRMLKSGFNNYLVESVYVVCGKYPKVLVTTNLEVDSWTKL